MRYPGSWLCLPLALAVLLPGAGCGKKRRAEPTDTGEPVAVTKTTTQPVVTQLAAPADVATKREPGPNVGLSGIGRFWTEQEVKNNLHNLGIAWTNYVAEHAKGPPDQKMLSPYYEKNAQINEALEKGWFTFAWKVGPQQMPEGASHTILAYEPDADNQGNRWVVMADGVVQCMPRDQFEKTPKAKGR